MTIEDAKERLIEELKDSSPRDSFYWSEHKIGDSDRTDKEEIILGNGLYWEKLDLEDDGKLKDIDDIVLEFCAHVATEKFKDHEEALREMVNTIHDRRYEEGDMFKRTMGIIEDLGFDFSDLNSTILATIFISSAWFYDTIGIITIQELIESLNEKIDS